MDREVNSKRAKYAYEEVVKAAASGTGALDRDSLKTFRSLARSFPMMIYNNGFGAAVAFLYAKRDNKAHAKLYVIIQSWMQDGGLLNKEGDLMNGITESMCDEYRVMTLEVLELMIWIKRFSEGMIQLP